MSSPSHNETTRYHVIDRLRAAMISVVVVGHALLPYVTVPRSFKDANTHVGFDIVAIYLYSFAMQAFFITAGFAAAMLLHRRGIEAFIQNRVRRIFVPLLIAYLILSPLTRGAYLFAREAAASGSLDLAFAVWRQADWLRWGKTYHLWFLVSLLLFSAIVLAARAALHWLPARYVATADAVIRRLIWSSWRALWLAFGVAAFSVPAYLVSAGESTKIFVQLGLLVFFVFGWLLYRHRDLLARFTGSAGMLMSLSLLVLVPTAWATRARLMEPATLQITEAVVAGVGNSLLGALVSCGLIGLAQRQAQPSGIGRYLSDTSYQVYLVHLPLVIAAGGVMAVTGLPAILKFAGTLALALPLVWLCVVLWPRNRGRPLPLRVDGS